jgi:hypothetical protein
MISYFRSQCVSLTQLYDGQVVVPTDFKKVDVLERVRNLGKEDARGTLTLFLTKTNKKSDWRACCVLHVHLPPSLCC